LRSREKNRGLVDGMKKEGKGMGVTSKEEKIKIR
jgi:hypothetical protein